MHMHFGAEEMFFVLSGRPVFRNQHGEEGAHYGRFRLLPRGTCRTTRLQQPHRRTRPAPCDQRRELPDVVAYPEHGYAWVAPAIPIPSCSREAATPDHRWLRDPDRVDGSALPAALETTKRPRERPLHFSCDFCVRAEDFLAKVSRHNPAHDAFPPCFGAVSASTAFGTAGPAFPSERPCRRLATCTRFPTGGAWGLAPVLVA